MKFIPNNKQEEKNLEIFNKSIKIKEYIEDCNPPSRDAYKGSLRDYFINIKQDPEKYITNPLNFKTRKEELIYKQKLKNDIIKHCNFLRDEYISPNKKTHSPPAPKSFSVRLNSIKKLLSKNSIDLEDYFWKNTIKRKYYSNTDSITEKDDLTKDQLKSILEICNTQYKAIFLLEMVTGSRINEIINLTFDDIVTDQQYPFTYIIIRSKNSKNNKYCEKPITPEAKEYIDLYLKQRDKYISNSNTKTKNFKLKNFKQSYSNKIFPITISTVEKYWKRQLDQLGLIKKDPQNNRITLGTHSLRRYFQNTFEEAHSLTWALVIMNKTTGLSMDYRNASLKKKMEEYSKGSNSLIIFKETIETNVQIEKLQERYTNLEGKYKDQLGINNILEINLKGTNEQLQGVQSNLNKSLSDLSVVFNKTIAYDRFTTENIEEYNELRKKEKNGKLTKKEWNDWDKRANEYYENFSNKTNFTSHSKVEEFKKERFSKLYDKLK